jgi:CubicO group peptidase (beta-lactamase class C family)
MAMPLSILKLVNEGKLSLQDPIHKLAQEVWLENSWEASEQPFDAGPKAKTISCTGRSLITAVTS